MQRRIHHKAAAGIVAVGLQLLGLTEEEMVAGGVEPAAQIAEPVLAALRVLGKDDVVAFLHLVDQLEALAGRGLAVVVQTNDDIALHLVEACHQRAVLAEIAAQIHKHHPGRLPGQRFQRARRVVRAAVVDQHDLVFIFRPGGKGVRQLLHHRADGMLGAVAGNDEGKHRLVHRQNSSFLALLTGR